LQEEGSGAVTRGTASAGTRSTGPDSESKGFANIHHARGVFHTDMDLE
jgi:hypothetical protein